MKIKKSHIIEAALENFVFNVSYNFTDFNEKYLQDYACNALDSSLAYSTAAAAVKRIKARISKFCGDLVVRDANEAFYAINYN